MNTYKLSVMGTLSRGKLISSCSNKHVDHCFVLGNQKANNGWSPIHLASYFGHADVLKLLLNVSYFMSLSNACVHFLARLS